MSETYRSRHISASDTLHWSIKVVEGLALDDLSANLATNTKLRESTLNNNEAKGTVNRLCDSRKGKLVPVSLLDRLDDSLGIERAN